MTYILKGQNNKTYIIKTTKDIGDISDKNVLFNLVDVLFKKEFIDLDEKEDLEFGTLYIPRDDELNFLLKLNFKVFEL